MIAQTSTDLIAQFAGSIGLGLLILLLVGVTLIIIFIAMGIRIIQEWERAPVLRLGRYVGLKGPGIFWIIPFLDRMAAVVSLRIQTYTFRSESTLTKDNVSVTIDAVLYFRVVNAEKAILEAEHYIQATQWSAQTTIREVIGQHELDELLAERATIADSVKVLVDEKTEHWGVEISAVEIKDITIPASLQDAISRQAEAERERRARITLAQAEKEAAKGMIEAADQYATSEIALELRWINLLFEAASQGNATILMIPANVPTAGFSQLGVYGVENIPGLKRKKTQEE